MTVDERRRFDLYEWARANMGVERAETLMESLLPSAWHDVATKQDIAALDHRFEGIDHRFEGIDHRFEAMEHRFDGMERRFDGLRDEMRGLVHEQSNRLIMWLVPTVIGSIALSSTLAAAV